MAKGNTKKKKKKKGINFDLINIITTKMTKSLRMANYRHHR